MKIETKDTEGRPNGWILPIWSVLEDPDRQPYQVYVTAVALRSRKGPHMHKTRRGMFTVIHGAVTIRVRYSDGAYTDYHMGPSGSTVNVSPGEPCALYNYGDTEALVLNMPAPAWSKDDPDEWPVENWVDPADWIPR